LTRDVLQRHLQGGTESAAALKRRLQVAADEIDLASIFTIHGFCTRVLREHALESGHTFDPPELLASDRELLEELAADLWRVHANDPATLEPLTWLWSNPDALAADLRALLGTPPLHPLPRPVALADPHPALQARRKPCPLREHGEQFFIDLCDAVDNKWINGVSYKLGWLHRWAGSCWPGPSAPTRASCWPANACRRCCRRCWPTRPTRSSPIARRRRHCRRRWRAMSRCWPNAMPGCVPPR
jgi:exodeoxyribonuclease V beta subunit